MAPMKSLWTFLGLFAVQFIGLAVADSAEGNPAAWKALSHPLIPLVDWFAENGIWLAILANGLLWSAVIATQLHRFVQRAGNRAGRA
jgi:hypothetical protein